MDINSIIDYISNEYSKGNKEPLIKTRSFICRVWRNEHKQKVKQYNKDYQNKIRKLLNNDSEDKNIKKTSYNKEDIKKSSYNDPLNIFS